jgi:aspartate/tyrosine/aromatic aminotransferase
MGQIKFVARAQYSNPPKHGAAIVDTVLSDPELAKEWQRELNVMSGRIALMRQALYDNLVKDSTLDWSHITRQIGMFAYTVIIILIFKGLTKEQVTTVKRESNIFLTDDGRISIAGLNTGNVARVAKVFAEITARK